MDLNASILPQLSQRKPLVLLHPDLTDSLSRLYEDLGKSEDLRHDFVEAPSRVLGETLDWVPATSSSDCVQNQVLHRLLQCVPPVVDGTDATAPYLALIDELTAATPPEAIAAALTQGFNAGVGSAIAAELELEANLRSVLHSEAKLLSHTALHTQTVLQAKLATALEAHAATELQVGLQHALNTTSALHTHVHAALQSSLETKLAAELRAELDTRLDAELRSNAILATHAELRAQLGTELRAQLEVELRLHLELRAQLEIELRAQLEAELRAEIEAQLAAKLHTAVESRLQANAMTEVKLNSIAHADLELDVESKLVAQAHVVAQIESETLTAVDLEFGAEADFATSVEGGLTLGIEGTTEGEPAIRRRSQASLSRFDLQRLAGFVAARPALANLILNQPKICVEAAR